MKYFKFFSILLFTSTCVFRLSLVEHEKRFFTLGPGPDAASNIVEYLIQVYTVCKDPALHYNNLLYVTQTTKFTLEKILEI